MATISLTFNTLFAEVPPVDSRHANHIAGRLFAFKRLTGQLKLTVIWCTTLESLLCNAGMPVTRHDA